MGSLIEKIRQSVIGENQTMPTPFGDKPLIYADYTASGRSLSFIEDYIREQVLPFYANTHTETSFTGAQTTALREQAREQIRSAVNGGGEDKVIFCGPGATAAINKLLDILNLRLPRELSQRYKLEQAIPADERPVIFIGPYEHHSNELPWRESIADVVSIPLTDCGQIDTDVLDQQLTAYASRPLLIGSFSAASNVTGIKSDVAGITAILKRHDALAFWDYAAAAPYIGIDMNGSDAIDAVFLSPHKFVGGPGTPGVLVVKRALLNNSVPAMVGGGTVVYVTPESHRYIDDQERREEGGTPGIVESIRAGLVFKLQQEVGIAEIERREASFVNRAIERFSAIENLEIMGNPEADRLSIMSLRFKHGDKDLHYGFVVSLLNDLFGIQTRGGCSCAGPYGHSLLAMDMQYSRAIEAEIAAGSSILRPGWVRLNFNYFIAEEEFDYLVSAIERVAQYGWRMLPYYQFDADTGVWRYQGLPARLLANMDTLVFADYTAREDAPRLQGADLSVALHEGEQQLYLDRSEQEYCDLHLCDGAERLRWFVLPQALGAELSQITAAVGHG
ncbi:MAG: aminotransferase class V-fold PLP-dependent enzyme [Halioglobus sp.]